MDVKKELTQRTLERNSQWAPVYVSRLPDVMDLDEMALLGAFSFSLPQSRRRIIKDTIKLEEGTRETPSAIARDYLRLIYKTGPRGTKRQLAAVDMLPPVPNVALPQKFAWGLYIDIHSCYWSIMNVAGWDVDYYPGMWLSPGRAPSDFPFPDHKIGRNCLVSAGITRGIPRYMPKKLPGDPFDEIQPGNKLSNTQLPRLIHDILNSIAGEAMKAGAVYCNNDGFIAPTPGIAARVIKIIQDWGLTATVKGEGSGQIRSSGAYRVGNVESLPFRMRDDDQPIMNVYPPSYSRWLKQQFTSLV